MSQNSRSQSFTVPASAGQYAPEVLLMARKADEADAALLDDIATIQGFLRSLPSGAELELDLFKPGSTDVAATASWNLDVGTAATSTGPFGKLELGGWHGGRFRMKSGGSAGTGVLDLTWTTPK